MMQKQFLTFEITSCYLREIEKQIHQAPEYYFGHTDDGNID
jgi:hypothetical protein